MSYQPFCLITEWPPAVEAYRVAGGMAFYWQANERSDLDGARLPFALERDFSGGWAFQAAEHYYQALRPYLPPAMSRPVEAYCGLIFADGESGRVNDLADDAGIEPDTRWGRHTWYSMRPATVARAGALAHAIDWAELEAIAGRVSGDLPIDDKYMPDVEYFRYVVDTHTSWLTEAAELGRGVVALVSY